WKDGEGWTNPPPGWGGNGTGSVVDVNTTTVHGGGRSLVFWYDNDGTNYLGTPDKAYYSEAIANTLELPIGSKDWTAAKALSLWFYGDPNNDADEQMYVKLNDGSEVVYDGDAGDVQKAEWQQWNIALSDFGVNLQNVATVCIGFGDENNTQPGGSGGVYFDDIRLYPSRCVLSQRSDDFARFDYVEDCVVDYKEVAAMAEKWLVVVLDPITITTITVPNSDFEEMY
ncbi:unnamed protein product, partial [marine sediment metagenome]